MGIRGNSGFKGEDKRFNLTARGTIGRHQHFLERTEGNFGPIVTGVTYTEYINEGFESGGYYTAFSATSDTYRWIVQNDAPNQWYVGTDQPFSGTYASYISNDAGVNNAYTDAGGSDSHIIMEFKVPTNIYSPTTALTMDLQFDWRCDGEYIGSTHYDYGYLRYTTTGLETSAGTLYTTGRILGNTDAANEFDGLYSASGYNWVVQTGSLNVSGQEGNTLRLVWSWHDDSAGGTAGDPPFALDNIILSYSALT